MQETQKQTSQNLLTHKTWKEGKSINLHIKTETRSARQETYEQTFTKPARQDTYQQTHNNKKENLSTHKQEMQGRNARQKNLSTEIQNTGKEGNTSTDTHKSCDTGKPINRHSQKLDGRKTYQQTFNRFSQNLQGRKPINRQV